MQTIELIKSAIQSLKANKKRSFLTIIGIMIGIAAVIAILGIGDGITKTMYDKFGNNAKQGQQTTEIVYNPDNVNSTVNGFTQDKLLILLNLVVKLKRLRLSRNQIIFQHMQILVMRLNQ